MLLSVPKMSMPTKLKYLKLSMLTQSHTPSLLSYQFSRKPHCAVTLLHWNAAACAPVAFSRDLAFPSVQGPGSQGFLDQPVSTWITCTP